MKTVLLIEIYEKETDEFVSEIDVTSHANLIRSTIPPMADDQDYCNPVLVKENAFTVLKKHLVELAEYDYSAKEYFIQCIAVS